MSLYGRFVCFGDYRYLDTPLISPIISYSYPNLRIEPAKVAYLPTVDMHVDTVEAMSEVASILHKEYM